MKCVWARWPLLAALAGGLAGCGQQEVKVYTVAKNSAAPQTPSLPPGHGEMMGASLQVTFKVPDGWKEKTAGQMRAAQFSVPGLNGLEADVSVIPLSGIQASREDIINIWREQLHLTAGGKSDLDKPAEKVTIGPAQGELIDLVSSEPLDNKPYKTRILVGTLAQGATTWFVKMTGPDELVGASRPAFIEFLKSLRFVAPELPAQTAMTPPPGMSSPASEAKPDWQVPPDWKEQVPGPMLTAKYMIAGDTGQDAEVTISVLGGTGGGALLNVNRWRGQLLLKPIEAGELGKVSTTLDLGDTKAMMLDMNGTSAKSGEPARMVVVSVPRGGQTWFYKLLGDEAVVTKQKDAFLKFVQTVKYPNAVQ